MLTSLPAAASQYLTVAVPGKWPQAMPGYHSLPTCLSSHQKSKPKLSYDQWSVGQFVLISGHHLGSVTNCSFSSTEIIYRHLWFYQYGVPSLMRGRVCNLLVQVLLVLASTVTLRSTSYRTWDHSLLSHLKLSSLFVASYGLQGYGGGILSCLHTWHHMCWFLVHSLATDPTENTTYNNSSTAACISAAAVMWFACHGNVFTEPLPSIRHLTWLHNPGIAGPCHAIIKHKVQELPIEIHAGSCVLISWYFTLWVMRLRSRKLRLTTVGDQPRWPHNTPLSTKVGTKFRRQVAAAQLVEFVSGLWATEFVFVCLGYATYIRMTSPFLQA
jgi:hypothetical protein